MTRLAYFELIETTPKKKTDEPWHVRITGGNHEPMLVGENLHNRDDAEAVVLSVARMFVPDPHLLATGEPLEWWVYSEGEQTAAQVLYVDEREAAGS